MDNSFNIGYSFKVNSTLEQKMHQLCQRNGWSVSHMIRQSIQCLLYSRHNNTNITTKNRNHLDQW